jgi:general L-amino acid transport system permease protein
VTAKLGQFIYGNYPELERWRVNLVFLFGAIGLALLVLPPLKTLQLPAKRRTAMVMLTVYPLVSLVLLVGGVFGLPVVQTTQWGGLLVTLVIAVTGIVASLPFGILLALGRRSALPAVRLFSIIFIEIWRGVPLVTVLFMASVMLPLFLPEGMNFDALLRCLIGVTFFAAAYMAEVIRGGLQAIPKGQYEAGEAMGLSYWKSMRLIILPQALTTSIPGIVNTFIGLFKDTTLVMIVGIFDLLGVVTFHFTDPNWATPQVSITGFVFAGAMFWVFCFAMSRYSIFIENKLTSDKGKSS